MSIRHRITLALIVAAFLVAAGLNARAALAGSAVRTPAGVAGDCSFAEHGQVIVIDDVEYHCVCGRLTGPNGPEIRCQWTRVDKAAATRRVKRRPKKPVARYGVKPGVLSAKAVAS